MESRIQELLILFCNSYELSKCLLIRDGEVSQHLAVDFNASLRQAVDELAVGDTVLTTSGFYGVVIDIAEDTVIVEFGSNKNCRIPMQKAAISAVEKPEDAVEKESK